MRVPMTVKTAASSVEQFTIGFINVTTSTATLSFAWDKTIATVDLTLAAAKWRFRRAGRAGRPGPPDADPEVESSIGPARPCYEPQGRHAALPWHLDCSSTLIVRGARMRTMISNIRAVRAARKSLPIVRGEFNIWMERNAFQHAAALAFYTLFSLAPLVIIIVAIIGIVLGDDAARGQVSAEIKDFVGAQAALAVEDAVRSSRMKDGGLGPTVVGIGMLLFGATTMFAQMQTSLNDFWGVVARPSRSGLAVFLTTRLLSLGVVLVIGFLLLTSLIISMSIVALIKWASAWIPIAPFVAAAVDLVLSWAVATALFATIFKMLPDVKLQWRDMWKAGAATAALFVAGQYGSRGISPRWRRRPPTAPPPRWSS